VAIHHFDFVLDDYRACSLNLQVRVYLNDQITTLPFIGGQHANKLARLGISTLRDLLFFFPRNYQDTRLITPIADLTDRDQKYSILATVTKAKNIRTRYGKTMQKVTVSDETGSINITWFNQPYLVNTLHDGVQAYFYGKLSPKSLLPALTAPEYDVVANNQINIGRIVPLYNLTAGITAKWIRRRIFDLLAVIDSVTDLTETLPKTIVEKYHLAELVSSLKEAHFPESHERLGIAERRLAFDELLAIQVKLLLRRKEREQEPAPAIVPAQTIKNKFIKALPYTLTPSQQKAIASIEEDLGKGHPMTRLIQGDVGSGKTVVAFIATLSALAAGYQVALLAPTSVLAEQHYELALKLFPTKYKIGMVTANTAKHIVKAPKLDLIIGTHAVLYHRDELLKNLGLIIIDEEHRFGVEQRTDLDKLINEQNQKAHHLSLTATPIPRSIALTLFGDMNMSKIEKPNTRKPCKTFIVPETKKPDSIAWIKKIIKDGGQIFWICPLIDDNPEMDAQSVTKLYEELIKIFPQDEVAFLHGKLKAKEKNSILTDFKAKKMQNPCFNNGNRSRNRYTRCKCNRH